MLWCSYNLKESCMGKEDIIHNKNNTIDKYDTKSDKLVEIEKIIKEQKDDVCNAIKYYIKDENTIDDVFQEASIKACLKINTFRGKSSLKTWFISIAKNCARDYIESAHSRRVITGLDGYVEDRFEDDVYVLIEKKYRKEHIKEVIESLPLKYKEIIVYVFYKGYSVVEASRKLNIAEGTARSRLRRAKKLIGEELEISNIWIK